MTPSWHQKGAANSDLESRRGPSALWASMGWKQISQSTVTRQESNRWKTWRT